MTSCLEKRILQTHIFAPLQMTQTVNVLTSFEVAQKADHLAQGHLLGLVGAFAPAAFVLAMPGIVLSTSGRAFGYVTLFRSMLEVMTWLALWGLLSALNGGARLVWLVQGRASGMTRKTGKGETT